MKEQPLLTITNHDITFYNQEIRPFLPDKIFDFHTHIWLKKHRTVQPQSEARLATWPARVAKDNSIEDLVAAYNLLFPDKMVQALVFSMAENGDDLDILNNYTAQSGKKTGFPALLFSHPSWSSEHLRSLLIKDNFLGIKVYLSLAPAYIPAAEIRIFDFAPPHHLEVINSLGGILMLHIPRPQRLKDPVNLAQIIEIEQKYPKIKLVIAHVGRAYCNEDIGNAFDVLAQTKNLFFDISANSNQHVFEQLIDTAGAKRILFGSDLPILRMRARRITENGVYVNLVPKGLYGDVSGDKNMRELTGKDAENLTFFIYEEIAAFKRAAERTGLNETDIQNIFFNNASGIIKNAAKPPQLQMVFRTNFASSVPPNKEFVLRNFTTDDRAAYIELMRNAGFSYWNDQVLQNLLSKILPNGIFLLTDGNKLIATASALHSPIADHPFGGEMGWVAVHPEYRGRKLSEIVCNAAISRLLAAGYQHIYLLTDDYRIPAIKTYFKLGFEPFYNDENTRKRWQTVKEQLIKTY